MFTRIGSFFTEASLWIWRVMQLNFIWLFHILLGGIVLGLFPATVAMFATTRKWLKGGIDYPMLQEYRTYYKENFWKTNALGWTYLCIGGFLVMDLLLVTQIQGVIALLSTFILVFLLVIYAFSFMYFFSYYVHFQQSFKQYLIQPFIITLISLKQNLLIAIGLLMIGYLIQKMPGLIPFTLGVMPAYWIMKISMNRYKVMQYGSKHEIVGGES
ncbi:YesL family protein [Sutcliffiella halmapala]|uniref:YesL family protein n=1 Tax=Sutcliffiella halmapala TaxID=79882 RepID=UPI0014742A23|nr:YesL family protein [Sutcliffiella halmapala]